MRGEALETYPGWFTLAAHFDPASGRLVWGSASLTEEQLLDRLPEVPGWAEEVALNGEQLPRLWLVSCEAGGVLAAGAFA